MKRIPINIWILIAIVTLGFFLRAYNISDWLRFGPDQARDAGIIGNIIQNHESLPLLGPQSGNTMFFMGPFYYWLGYASAFIFGINPPAFAYPIIFFSVLSIPLLFYFLKQFFSKNISLTLIFIYAISYFSIINSRYASNVNLIPFFLILFLLSIIKIVQPSADSKIGWYILWGISLGFCIQLHTLLFVSLPLISLLAFFYLLYNRSLKFIGIILAVLFFVTVNWSQIFYDLKFQGANISGFFHGIETQSGGKSSLLRNMKLVTACQLQANAQIIFPIERREDCEILDFSKNYKGNSNVHGETKGLAYAAEVILVLAFSIGGYFLLFKYLFKKDTPFRQKIFLAISTVYNAITFLVFIPVAGEIGTRYFLVLIFMPFILLGLWVKAIFESTLNIGAKKIIIGVLFSILIVGNIYNISADVKKFKAGRASGDRLSVLSEIMPIADYIAEKSEPNKEIILSGERTSMNRFDKAIIYLVQKKDIKIRKSDADEEKGKYFWIGLDEKGDGKELFKKIKNQNILDSRQFGDIWIYILNNIKE